MTKNISAIVFTNMNVRTKNALIIIFLRPHDVGSSAQKSMGVRTRNHRYWNTWISKTALQISRSWLQTLITSSYYLWSEASYQLTKRKLSQISYSNCLLDVIVKSQWRRCNALTIKCLLYNYFFSSTNTVLTEAGEVLSLNKK